MSPEAGIPYEQHAYWAALANSRTHQVCTFKNCSSLRLKFLQNWENYPGKTKMQTRKDGSDIHHFCPAFRYPFPPRIQSGETQTQVFNTAENIKAMTLYQIEGTEKILAMIHYGAHGERDEMIKEFGVSHRYRNVLNHYTGIHKGIGIYVGPPMPPRELWNTVYGEELKGNCGKVEGSNFAYFYDDKDNPDLSLETDLNDEVRVRVKAGFNSPFEYECRIVLEEI